MKVRCGSAVFARRTVEMAVIALGGMVSALAQIPPQGAAPQPGSDFRVTSIPPGKVVYKTLAEMPEGARAPLLRIEAAGVSTQKTSDGVSFRTFPVDDAGTTLIERERDRYIRLSQTAKSQKLPGYILKSSLGAMKNEAMLVEKSSDSGDVINGNYIFSSPDGLYMLKEWSYAADGGSVIRILDYCNAKVNDIPATYSAMHGPAGGTIRQLKWVTNTKAFDLYYKGTQSDDKALAQLLKLAQSISK